MILKMIVVTMKNNCCWNGVVEAVVVPVDNDVKHAGAVAVLVGLCRCRCWWSYYH